MAPSSSLRPALLLALACAAAFGIRLFPLSRYGHMLHEGDAHFNMRATQQLVDTGFESFLDWFDTRAWHPLGREVGRTLQPGLVATCALLYNTIQLLHFPVSLLDLCIFLPPVLASLSVLVTYALTKELKDGRAGLVAAVFMAMVPAYLARSMAGAFDCEALGMPLLLLGCLAWIKAVKTGSGAWAAGAAAALVCLALTWGAHVFLAILIPLHVAALLLTGCFDQRAYVAYSVFYCLGPLLSSQLFVLTPHPLFSAEYALALAVFLVVQVIALYRWAVQHLAPRPQDRGMVLSVFVAVLVAVAGAAVMLGDYAPHWTPRFIAALDPTFAAKHSPLLASAADNQPATWASFFLDLHLLLLLAPAGLVHSFRECNSSNVFLVLFGLTSAYLAGVMVRLMLVLAPAACILAAVGVTDVLWTSLAGGPSAARETPRKKQDGKGEGLQSQAAAAITVVLGLFLALYCLHCTWVAAGPYTSSPLVLSASHPNGSTFFMDDFREAYAWMRDNTPEDAKVLAWWDYGHHIAALGNRTALIDSSTWNVSHIARVAEVLVSSEADALPVMHALGATHVMVVCGARAGFSADDINKLVWMVRIARSTPEGQHIKESNYYTSLGEFLVGKTGASALHHSVLYKACYHRFGLVYTEKGKPGGYDRVRRAEVLKGLELLGLAEAFTSPNWLVRVYEVLDTHPRGLPLED